jgi:hypothetical protein
VKGVGAGAPWPWLAAITTAAVAAAGLRALGRSWLCDCGVTRFWTGEAWGAETSQQLFDPYSFTHVLHGFVFCWLLAWGLPKLSAGWRLWAAVLVELSWELFENTEFVIRRYREATAALGYNGDTILNSLGDVAACALGFGLAARLGLRASLALFAVVEVALLVMIRDSLLLSVLMLVFPTESLKAWQAGH